MILQDLTGKLLPNTNVLLVRNFSAKSWMKHTRTNMCIPPQYLVREKTHRQWDVLMQTPCALGPGSIGSELQLLVLASEDL